MRIENTVTGEYMNLTSLANGMHLDYNLCGLGFSGSNNRFKAIRMVYDQKTEDAISKYSNWRRYKRDSFNTFVNECFHWIVSKWEELFRLYLFSILKGSNLNQCRRLLNFPVLMDVTR